MDWHDLAGISGATMIVVAYALLQLERLSGRDLSYSLLNAVGAALILLSLAIDFNLSAFVIEAFWLVISLVGIGRCLRGDRGAPRG